MKRRRSGKRKKGRRSVKISNGSLSSWKRKRTRGLIPHAPVTGKRKRAAEAEKGKEAVTDRATAEMREAEPKKQTQTWKKKKKKGGNYKRRRRARKN
jgi:hypothetical protein